MSSSSVVTVFRHVALPVNLAEVGGREGLADGDAGQVGDIAPAVLILAAGQKRIRITPLIIRGRVHVIRNIIGGAAVCLGPNTKSCGEQKMELDLVSFFGDFSFGITTLDSSSL